jgi:dolichyl-phosphate-mannose--protein O-mannosyl transferase
LGNTFNHKLIWLRNLRLSARITSIIFIIYFTLFVFFMSAMFNKPAPASDYIVLTSCSIYVIGLLIGFKWEFLGGLISIGFLAIALIYSIYWDINSNFYNRNYIIYIGIFILMIPCILYIISWYFHRNFA